MKVLAEPGDEEFESLPPALRRKYFPNNAERVRLQLALTHHNHRHGSLSPSPSRVAAAHLHSGTITGTTRTRSRPLPNALNRDRSLSRSHRLAKSLSRSCDSRKLCKPRSLQLAYLAAQADSQCFYSLPAKIQQKHFSEEERRRFRISYQRFVLDAADRHSNLPSPSLRSRPSQSTVPFSQASTLCLDPSDPRNMDDSLYDSFRWLDEDAELDLSLDGHHAHNVNTMPKRPTRRRPSFRRTMSFNSVNLGRKPSSAVRHKRFPSLSRTSNPTTTPANTNTISRVSTSRPPSRNDIARSSTSSVEPSAQYYHDPEARLKLRVYLSSPQKFDEAIQFGFPALENKESHSRSPEPPAETKPEPPEFTGTFLDDGDGDGDGDDKSVGERDDPEPDLTPKSPSESRLSNDIKENQFKPALCGGQWLPWSSGPQDQPGSREMTLKMTLTRPDLRDSATPSPVENKLRDADVSAGDGSRSPELELEEQGPVKKMWRKFWRQRA